LIKNLQWAGLQNNLTKILPVRFRSNKVDNVYEIINIINNTPKNLNGNTLIFQFAIPFSEIANSEVNVKNIDDKLNIR
jgi:hypothetical protein